MDGCDHKSCGNTEKVWLPYQFQGRELGLKPHPYCVKCGIVKNMSSERPKKIGFFVNIVASIGKQYKVTQVQMRLVAQALEKSDIEDDWGLDRRQQEEMFVNLAMKYLGLSENAIREFL